MARRHMLCCRDGRVVVVPNHTDSEIESDEEDMDYGDDEDGLMELEDAPNGGMDLYE